MSEAWSMMIGSFSVELRSVDVEQVLPLRHAILRPGLPRESADFEGDREPATRHYAAFIGRRCVGCLSFMRRPLDGVAAWQLRGMAVAEDYQDCGIGGELLKFGEQTVRSDDPAALLWCNARTSAAGFYEKHGWRIICDEFDVPGVGPHFRMAKS